MAARRQTRKTTQKARVRKSSVKSQVGRAWVVVGVLLGLAVIVGLYTYQQKGAVPAEIFVVDQPNSFAFSDRFGDGALDKGRWRIVKSEGVAVNETPGDNLRILISEGASDNKHRSGSLYAREVVSPNQDFATTVRMYKPIVSGQGAVGRVGLSFAAGEDESAEGVQIYWEVSASGTSELVFYSKFGNAEEKIQRVAVNGKEVQIALRRSDTEYLASYRLGIFGDDNPYEAIGDAVVGPAASNGRLRIFARNGIAGTYGRVLARIDSVTMSSNKDTSVMKDGFYANGPLNSDKWEVGGRDANDPVKNNGNLRMSIMAKAVPTGKVETGISRLRSTVDISRDKKGAAIVDVFKPSVNGQGGGAVGVVFYSDSNKNDESAKLMWKVEGNNSRLVFSVTNAKGEQVERESMVVPARVNRMTLILRHGDGAYMARYRFGVGLDDDKGFKTLGTVRNEKLGAKGWFGLVLNQISSGSSAPAVSGRVDSFRVIYE